MSGTFNTSSLSDTNSQLQVKTSPQNLTVIAGENATIRTAVTVFWPSTDNPSTVKIALISPISFANTTLTSASQEINSTADSVLYNLSISVPTNVSAGEYKLLVVADSTSNPICRVTQLIFPDFCKTGKLQRMSTLRGYSKFR